MSENVLYVEYRDGRSAYGSYGHRFASVDEASAHLRAHGGGSITVMSASEAADRGLSSYVTPIDAEPCEIWISTGGDDDLLLDAVMTPREIEEEFGLAAGTVRQAVGRGVVTHSRPDERTILITRREAVRRWGKRSRD